MEENDDFVPAWLLVLERLAKEEQEEDWHYVKNSFAKRPALAKSDQEDRV